MKQGAVFELDKLKCLGINDSHATVEDWEVIDADTDADEEQWVIWPKSK